MILKKLALLKKELHRWTGLLSTPCHANAKYALEYKLYSSQWLQSLSFQIQTSHSTYVQNIFMFSLQDSEIDVYFCLFKVKVQLFLHTKKTILPVLKLQSFFHLRRVFSL